jgi:hypothetical protein
MIRPSNIRGVGNLADFKCDIHGGVANNLNLIAKTQRVKNDGGGAPDANSDDVIIISGAELTPPCNCTTTFPAFDPRNELAYQVGQARPKP